MKKVLTSIRNTAGITLAILLVVIALQVLPIAELYELPSSVVMTFDEMEDIHLHDMLATEFVPDEQAVCTGSKIVNGRVNFLLFNLFPMRSVQTKVQATRKVFGGGFPIGMILNCAGVVVVSGGDVSTEYGKVSGTSQLRKGDIIKSIDGHPILHTGDISTALGQRKNVVVKVLRGEQTLELNIAPIIDGATGQLKLGVWVKDRISGLGTVSFVHLDGRFGALGHPIIDSDTAKIFPCNTGTCYNARIMGVQRGAAGVPGELRGSFSPGDDSIGTIDKNNQFGVFGRLTKFTNDDKLFDVGTRLNVKPGRAQILATVSADNQPKFYDIEIVKASHQTKHADKSMVIKVTDRDLLKQTGGIVQGMSGSPIFQNNKLVGAVTHVFVNDPTRGYGIYADWMIDQ